MNTCHINAHEGYVTVEMQKYEKYMANSEILEVV